MEAQLVQGDYDTIDHTPSGAVVVGEIVVIGHYPCIAHHPIAANALGSVAVNRGVYSLDKSGSSGPNVAIGDALYFIVSTNLFTNVASGNKHWGWAIAAAGASVNKVLGYHSPNGTQPA